MGNWGIEDEKDEFESGIEEEKETEDIEEGVGRIGGFGLFSLGI